MFLCVHNYIKAVTRRSARLASVTASSSSPERWMEAAESKMEERSVSVQGGEQESVNGSMEVIIWCLPFGQVIV